MGGGWTAEGIGQICFDRMGLYYLDGSNWLPCRVRLKVLLRLPSSETSHLSLFVLDRLRWLLATTSIDSRISGFISNFWSLGSLHISRQPFWTDQRQPHADRLLCDSHLGNIYSFVIPTKSGTISGSQCSHLCLMGTAFSQFVGKSQCSSCVLQLQGTISKLSSPTEAPLYTWEEGTAQVLSISLYMRRVGTQ